MTMPGGKGPNNNEINKKASKPLIEKRRRARINQSLEELKTLILDSKHSQNEKDPTTSRNRHAKLEKADILEMAVAHLRNLIRQNSPIEESTHSFEAGYTECAHEVARYLQNMDGINPSIRARLFKHLSLRFVHNQSESESANSSPSRSTPGTSASSSPSMDTSVIDEDNSNCSSTASVSSYEDNRRSNDCKPMDLATSNASRNSELSRYLQMENSRRFIMDDDSKSSDESVWRPW